MTWGPQGRAGERLKDLRVLIVDDEPLIAMDLERILEDAGATVGGVAGNVEDAMGLARAQA